MQLFCVQQILLGQDTLAVTQHIRHKFKPESMKATMMAVSFPGLGQIYNRKYWKIPIVYIGFAGLIYGAGFYSKNYTMYVKGYQDFTDNIPQTNSYLKLISSDPAIYDPVLHPKTYTLANFSYFKEGLLRLVDYYKRNRDLTYIGIGAWYLVSILDANVDASLFNYDVSNNLNITFVPIQMTLPGGFVGAGFGVDLKVNF